MLFRLLNFPSLIRFSLFKYSFSKTIHKNTFFRFSSSTALALSSSETHFTKPSKISSFDPNTFKILQNLYLYQNNPSLAFSYFTQLKNQHGFSHNIETYASIIRIMCYWNWIRKLDSLFIDIIEHSRQDPCFEINDLFDSLFEGVDVNQNQYLLRAFDGFVKACVSCNMFDEAIDFLFRFRNRSLILPNIFSFNFLINRLVKHDKVDWALCLFEHYWLIMIKSFGLIFNNYTYTIVIKALCKKGDLQQACRMIDEMEEAGVTPDSYCYATYIEGLCKNNRSDWGYAVLQGCRAGNTHVEVYAYTAIIRGFCNEMKLVEAEKVFLEMETKGLDPDVYVYCALVHGYCKRRNLKKAKDLHNYMVAKGIEANCAILSCILHCLGDMGRDSEVIAMFEENKQSGVILDGKAYNIVFDALCKMGKVDNAVHMLEDLQSMHIDLDIKHYTTLINGYCLQGNLDLAYCIFKEIAERGFKHDVVVYNVLISGLFRKGRADEAIDLFSCMDSQDVTPNSTTHMIIIEGFCSAGRVEDARAHFNRLEDKSVEIYSAMINGYCKADLIEESNKVDYLKEAYLLFKNMEMEKRIKPDVIAYTVILKGFLNRGNTMNRNHAKMVLELYKEMCDQGMTPGTTLKRCIEKAMKRQFHSG